MTENNNEQLKQLKLLRDEIDRLDKVMHEALMARGDIVSRIKNVKQNAGAASAFRPLRELEMMQAFAANHKGDVPLKLVIALWRNIISTFTYQQFHYTVHILAEDIEAARAHFGFSVPFLVHETPQEIIASVKASTSDLGFINLKTQGTWWQGLGEGNPLIMATYPVLEPPQAVIIAHNNIETTGLPTKFIVENEKLVQLPRDRVTTMPIVGYA